MTPSSVTPVEQERIHALSSANEDLSACVLVFPLGTFSAALLIGVWGSVYLGTPMPQAFFWIILSVCVLFILVALRSAKAARRGLEKAGMPPHEIRRMIAGMWLGAAILMAIAGGCVLGSVAMGSDLFGPLDRPAPLVITFVLYLAATFVLLGWSWRGRWAGRAQEPAASPAWLRLRAVSATNRISDGLVSAIFAGSFLGVFLAIWHGPLVELGLAVAFLALVAGLGVYWIQQSRRSLEAAGLSPAEIEEQIASAWRTLGFVMAVSGAFGLVLVLLGADLLNRAELLQALATTVGYAGIGLFLLWKYRRKRGV
jgi:hypothetical protein